MLLIRSERSSDEMNKQQLQPLKRQSSGIRNEKASIVMIKIIVTTPTVKKNYSKRAKTII